MSTVIVNARRRRPAARVVTLLVAALPLAALAGTPIDKRTEADPGGTVEISNTAGSVMVTGWDRNEVEVTGELGKGTERLEFTKADKITRIKVVLPNRSHNVDDTDLIVKVPAGSLVSINTVSADIGVQAVRGTQRLQSVSGDMRTETSGEDLECRTVSGDVTISGSGKKGLVSVTTVSGNATATRLAGEVNGSTVSGDFTLGVGRNQQVAPAIDQRQPDAAGLAGAGRARRHRKHQRGRAARPGRQDRRGLRRLELQRRYPPLLRTQARAHGRIRPGQGMAPPGRQRQRPRAHQDLERRRRRVQQVATRGYAPGTDWWTMVRRANVCAPWWSQQGDPSRDGA